MGRCLQEFFWTPAELTQWVQRACREFELWLVVWRVGCDAEQVGPERLSAALFEGTDESVQLFLGDPSLSPAPRWRADRHRREIDFPGSYAVQLIPSLVPPGGDVLLQGQLAVMGSASYPDEERFAALGELCRLLQADLKRNSDPRYVVVQSLASGGRKRWKDVLVGPAVPNCGAKLKQFPNGSVEFSLELAQ